MGSVQTKLLYHYTNKKGADAIDEDKVIRASTGANGDAVFGKGVYFTSIDPSYDPKSILHNNYDDGRVVRQLWERIEWVIEVYIPIDEVQKAAGNRDVYLYRGDVNLTRYQHRIYQNPRL